MRGVCRRAPSLLLRPQKSAPNWNAMDGLNIGETGSRVQGSKGSRFRVQKVHGILLKMAQGIASAIAHEVAAWPGVSVRSHAPGFLEFRVDRRELGHLHGDRLADLPFPVRVREELVVAGKATIHHAHPESGWVSFYIRSSSDVAAVIDLFRLNYERPWLSR
jgi:hypothetical protein